MAWPSFTVFSCSAECLICSCIFSHLNVLFPLRQENLLVRTDTEAGYMTVKNKNQIFWFSGNMLAQKCLLWIHTIAALLKSRLCGATEMESTAAFCEEQDLAMTAFVLQAVFNLLLVELLHCFFSGFFICFPLQPNWIYIKTIYMCVVVILHCILWIKYRQS